jgi:PrtD family type I secretion system ABC transporter
MAPFSPLKQAYAKYRAVLGATVMFSFFVNLLMFVGPMYMLQIYDRVLASRNETTLIMISSIAVALLVTYGLLEFTRSRMLVRTGLQFDQVLASPLFARVMRLQLSNPAAGGRNALSDGDKVRDFITGQGVLAFFDAPWTPLFLLLCFTFHPWLGIVATVGTVIIFFLAILNEVLTRKNLQEANTAGAEAANFAGATLQNAEVIRAMGMTDQLSARWLAKRDDMLVAQAHASDWAGVVLSSSKFVRMTLQVAILGVGGYLAMKQQISPGIMIAASIVMGRALAPVEQAVGQWKQFVAARQANTRLHELFGNMSDEPERMILPDAKGAIKVDGLTSVMPGSRDTILRGVSFGINAGECLSIIGPSGSGKSTLAKHLVGVMDPAVGTVRLDGVELKHWDPKQLGNSIGYLGQDISLFAGSVAENISRFQEGAADEDIVSAASLAGAHEMISGLRDGYATLIGNGGSGLSGGQRQRVGLARALFSLPSLIVLDEPNSNLDSEGEVALATAIAHLKTAGKTVIVITHKANLLSLSDKTLIMSGGTVKRFVETRELLQPQQPAAAQVASMPTAPVLAGVVTTQIKA